MSHRFLFSSFSKAVARGTGHPIAFGTAGAVIVVWLASGPLFDFSNTWQLVINTGTTIVTFLMVFLIQNTQNRDSEAIQVKLDELIRATAGAHNALLDLEELTQEDLDKIRARYVAFACRARESLREGGLDTGARDLDDEPDRKP